MRAAAVFATGLGLIAASAAGAAIADDDICRNGSFPSTEFDAIGQARITGADKVHLIEDSDAGCPSDAAKCVDRAYLIAGDTVLTGRTHGGYVCAFFPNRFGGSAGWLKPQSLVRLPPEPPPTPAAWSGTWRDGDDQIRLTANGGRVSGKGEAYWPSAHPSSSEAPGGPNLGDFAGASQPKGASLTFKDGDCEVRLKLIGGFLVAADNSQCGGMNVRFDGVYRKR